MNWDDIQRKLKIPNWVWRWVRKVRDEILDEYDIADGEWGELEDALKVAVVNFITIEFWEHQPMWVRIFIKPFVMDYMFKIGKEIGWY